MEQYIPTVGDFFLVGSMVQNLAPDAYDFAAKYLTIDKKHFYSAESIIDDISKPLIESYSNHVSGKNVVPGIKLFSPETMQLLAAQFIFEVGKKVSLKLGMQDYLTRELLFTMSGEKALVILKEMFPKQMGLEEMVTYQPSLIEIEKKKAMNQVKQQYVQKGFDYVMGAYKLIEKMVPIFEEKLQGTESVEDITAIVQNERDQVLSTVIAAEKNF